MKGPFKNDTGEWGIVPCTKLPGGWPKWKFLPLCEKDISKYSKVFVAYNGC